MRSNFAFILVALILLFPALILSDVYYPAVIKVENIGELETQVNATWTLQVHGNISEVKEVRMEVFGFSNYSSQYVKNFTASPAPEINVSKNGEDTMLIFTWTKPRSQTLVATAQFIIVTNFQNSNLSSPQIFPLNSSTNFLADSPLIFTDDEMNSQDAIFANGSSDAFQIAAEISEWVHNNMVYDLQYGNINLTAPEVFKLRRGVCDEYSNLAAAFLRRLGIPAKVSLGYVFSGQVWGLHSWVEIYSPSNAQWIPMDPTFNEMGVLDASHLRIISVPDQSYASEESSALSTGNVTLELSRNVSISVIRLQDFTKHAALSLSAKPFNSTAEIIYANISNPFEEYLFAPITIHPASGAEIFGESERLEYLKPYGSKQLDWVINFPEMQHGYVYTYSIVVSTLGEEQAVSFDKSPDSEIPQQQQGAQASTNAGKNSNLPCAISFALLALMPAILFARRS